MSYLKHIRRDLQDMQAYTVQGASGMVKLDAMENPHRLSPQLQAQLGERLGAVAVNRYPGSRIDDLKRAIAQHTGLPQGYGLMLGNGSDELISLLSMACQIPGAVALAPEPGFVMYAMSAKLQGLTYVPVSLRDDFELDEPAMSEAIAKHQPAIVYLAYPNNPTANLWDANVMRRLIAQVLLMRTLSKFGLAGVRIGYMLARTEVIDQLDKIRPPYNISVLNAECALFALEHADVFEKQARDICHERQRLSQRLAAFPGVTVYPSQANMMLLRFPGDDDAATRVFAALKSKNILVKNVSKMHPVLHHCLRITVGTSSENDQFLLALKEVLA